MLHKHPSTGAPKARNGAPKARNGAPKARNGAPKARNRAPKARNRAPKAHHDRVREAFASSPLERGVGKRPPLAGSVPT